MNKQNQQLQQAANAVQQARQTLTEANNNPDPGLMQKAQQQVENAKQLLNQAQGQNAANTEFQQIQQQLNETQNTITQTQQVLNARQAATVQPDIRLLDSFR